MTDHPNLRINSWIYQSDHNRGNEIMVLKVSRVAYHGEFDSQAGQMGGFELPSPK